MIVNEEGVNVVSILGNDYSIKAPEGQEKALADAVVMLKTALAETKRNYPTLIGDRLLVLAALNLCSRQVELKQQHQSELERCQQQVSATVDVISRVIGEA